MNTFRNRSSSLRTVMTVLLVLLAAGCGSGGSGGGSGTGTLAVSLTDSPACGFDAVNVTVSKVRVHQSDSASDGNPGWSDITLDPPRKINLLDLNDPTQPNLALDRLGETPLTAGHYTQLRLVLVPNRPGQPPANSVVLSTQPATEIPLETPSGIQSGIKLIHEFDVASGQRVDLLLDFDACKSVVARSNGTYALKPVIKVMALVLNGIQGFLATSLFPSQVNVNNVMVSAQAGGEIVRTTVPNARTGEFFLARLAPGNYDVVITADSHATAVIASVPVASSTSITTISTNVVPFTLDPSNSQSITGTVTLDPADDDGAVLVAAKQTLNPGPTVTVKAQVATLMAGNPVGDYSYALTLPIGAPSLGQYGTSLPIPLTAAAQSAVAGVYTVQSSAQTPTTVYATQTSSPVNITAGSQTVDFTLSP